MERVEDGSSMNVVPPMFHAGISNKFTKRHIANFRDTTLTAASAAKQRAERKLERQADAIEKQQQKIDHEMKKIEEITQNLHRQQLREAKRLRSRLNYAASKIQAVYRHHLARMHRAKRIAAVHIQKMIRGFLGRQLCLHMRIQLEEDCQNFSSMVITGYVRRYSCRRIRAREIDRRTRAACAIQSRFRIALAQLYVEELRKQRHEADLRDRAAILIQCNARSFMTRLIYLDVLYLICRIQATMRGYLVRKQMRWIRAADVEAISRLQARIRGYLVRRRLQIGQNNVCCRSTRSSMAANFFDSDTTNVEDHNKRKSEDSGHRFGRAASFSVKATDQQDLKHLLSRASTGLERCANPDPVIKRSYWLPAGASFDRRLPVLPVPKRMIALEGANSDNDDPLNGYLSHNRTPKKRPLQKPCPARLSPVVIPSVHKEENEVHLQADERARRQEELKQKLLRRKTQEKCQLERDLKLKRDAENEANERKLMEREEKAMRLQLKIMRRRSREGKIRQVTADQRREERERLAMAREERHIRLHAKYVVRQRVQKRQQLSTASSESESRALPTRGSDRKSPGSKSQKGASGSKDDDSEDDGDMSFLDINFTVPASMKSRKQGSSKSKTVRAQAKAKGKTMGKKISQVKRNKATPGRDTKAPLSQRLQDELDDCGYGDEFEEVEDEAALGRLIC